MAYEVYKKELTKEKYFENWDSDNYKQLTENLQNQIYEKYLCKCRILIRDKFVCQNKNCETPESELTMHHIKFQSNGGKNKERNCVTLCKTCHKGFHRGKYDITFKSDGDLPNHIKGNTFKIDMQTETNWKEVKKEMRKFRKNMKNNYNIHISEQQLYFLLKWLENTVGYDD